jgi:hypothetical protein
MRTKDVNDDHLVRYYDSAQEVIDIGKMRLHQHETSTSETRHDTSITGEASFTGSDSMQQTIDMAEKGWPKGREQFRQILGVTSELTPNGNRIEAILDVAGDTPDIDNYLLGVPENMATLHHPLDSTPGKVVKILLNRGARGHVEERSIQRYGAAVFLAAQTAITLGYSVAIDIFNNVDAGYGGQVFETHIPILEAGDPINLDTLVFWLANPSVLRRLNFAIREYDKPIRKMLDGGEGYYGGSIDMEEKPEGVDIFCGKHSLQLGSDEEVQPKAYELLRSVGIEPETED